MFIDGRVRFTTILEIQPLAVKHGETAVADACRQNVQVRVIREFVETAIPVKLFTVASLENRVRCVTIAIKRRDLGDPPHHVLQRQTPHDIVSHVELDELEDLRDRFVETLIIRVVAIPIQRQMSRQNAPAGDRSDIRHVLQLVRVFEEADDPQMIQRGAKSASR